MNARRLSLSFGFYIRHFVFLLQAAFIRGRSSSNFLLFSDGYILLLLLLFLTAAERRKIMAAAEIWPGESKKTQKLKLANKMPGKRKKIPPLK